MAVFTTLALTGAAAALGVAGTIATGAAIYGTAAAIGGTVKSAKAAQAAASTAQQATQVQIQQQRQTATRQRRSAVRSSIIARARGQQVAQQRGVATSSGFQGGISSLSSQLGANLGFGSMMSGLGQQFTGLSGLAAQQTAQSQRYSAMANIGMQVAQFGFSNMGPRSSSPLSAGEQTFGTGSDYITSSTAG